MKFNRSSRKFEEVSIEDIAKQVLSTKCFHLSSTKSKVLFGGSIVALRSSQTPREDVTDFRDTIQIRKI